MISSTIEDTPFVCIVSMFDDRWEGIENSKRPPGLVTISVEQLSDVNVVNKRLWNFRAIESGKLGED